MSRSIAVVAYDYSRSKGNASYTLAWFLAMRGFRCYSNRGCSDRGRA